MDPTVALPEMVGLWEAMGGSAMLALTGMVMTPWLVVTVSVPVSGADGVAETVIAQYACAASPPGPFQECSR